MVRARWGRVIIWYLSIMAKASPFKRETDSREKPMSKQVNAQNVAELFLSWANKDGELITNLKMQKLLYYAQAWHLVNFDKRLFEDPIEAWDLGPVIPQVYRSFKKFRHGPIEHKENGNEEGSFSEKQLSYLREFYNTYIGFKAHELVNMTHNEQPWNTAFETGSDIDSDEMKAYYVKLYRESKK